MKPTRKWIANQIAGLGAIATMYVSTGAWDQEESIALIGLITQAGVTWLLPNSENNPGTVSPLEGKKNGPDC